MTKLVVPRFDKSSVLVVGDVMLDRYWHGGSSRISPEAPVPVVNVEDIEDRIGGAANVALNVASLGAGASLVGVVGNDEGAQVLSAKLTAAGIRSDFQVSADKPTIMKLRVISRHQQLLRLDFEKPFNEQDTSELQDKVGALLSGVGALILSDYAKGSLRHCAEFIAQARAQQVPVLVDPKGDDFSKYRGATLITPNLSEFQAVVGVCDSEQQLVQRGMQLLENLDIEALLITRSEQGMTLLQRGCKELHLPTHAKEVFDVTGAGDTVIGVVAAALASGESLANAITMANIAAGVVVGKLGTATVTLPELRRAMTQSPAAGRGVVNEEQLLADVANARKKGERIVFTNGCFDILHAGHVGYLEQARQLGDRLIVAINGDDSVKRLKGAGRPINPVDRRMAVLAGLEAVDWVLSFDDDTPERLLALLRPDILVKGGDYSRHEVVGWEIVEGYGGEIAALDFLDDCSTTAIVNKIQDNE